MANVPGFNLLDIVDGGAAEKATEIFFTLKLDGGTGIQEINVFWPYEKFGALVAALSEFAAITTAERKKLYPDEDSIDSLNVTYSNDVESSSLGPTTDGKRTILRLNLKNRTRFEVAFDRPTLERLHNMMGDILQMDPDDDPPASTKKRLN